MRFNEKELIGIAQRDGDLMGRLQYTQYKGPPGLQRNAGFRDRFFKLIGNLLFYFRVNELGAVDFKEPLGVLVLENYSVQPEYDVDLTFAFGILFLDEPDKRHVFTARTDTDVQLWINKLQTASYQHWNQQLGLMRTRLNALVESRLQAVSETDFQQSVSVTPKPESIQNDFTLIAFEDDGPSVPPRTNIASLPPPPVPRRPVLLRAEDSDDDLIKL